MPSMQLMTNYPITRNHEPIISQAEKCVLCALPLPCVLAVSPTTYESNYEIVNPVCLECISTLADYYWNYNPDSRVTGPHVNSSQEV